MDWGGGMGVPGHGAGGQFHKMTLNFLYLIGPFSPLINEGLSTLLLIISLMVCQLEGTWSFPGEATLGSLRVFVLRREAPPKPQAK